MGGGGPVHRGLPDARSGVAPTPPLPHSPTVVQAPNAWGSRRRPRREWAAPRTYGLVTASPVTNPSVLWAKRMPYTPSVDFRCPAPTTSDFV